MARMPRLTPTPSAWAAPPAAPQRRCRCCEMWLARRRSTGALLQLAACPWRERILAGTGLARQGLHMPHLAPCVHSSTPLPAARRGTASAARSWALPLSATRGWCRWEEQARGSGSMPRLLPWTVPPRSAARRRSWPHTCLPCHALPHAGRRGVLQPHVLPRGVHLEPARSVLAACLQAIADACCFASCMLRARRALDADQTAPDGRLSSACPPLPASLPCRLSLSGHSHRSAPAREPAGAPPRQAGAVGAQLARR